MSERLELFDTHTHLDHAAFDRPGEGAGEVWRRAREAGGARALLVGVAPSTWSRTVDVARALPGMGHALGVHPQVVPELDDATIDDALRALPDLLVRTGAIAVGECGLDGPSGDLDRQARVLRAHLAIANDLALPVSLHVFKVHGKALEVLRAIGRIRHGGVLHSYSGSAELVRAYVDLGWSIGFAGAITRTNAKRPVLAARATPAEHLVIETDAPFQPTGGDARDRTRGEPADLPEVLAAVAAARGEDPGEVARRTTENARRIFSGSGSGEAPTDRR